MISTLIIALRAQYLLKSFHMLSFVLFYFEDFVLTLIILPPNISGGMCFVYFLFSTSVLNTACPRSWFVAQTGALEVKVFLFTAVDIFPHPLGNASKHEERMTVEFCDLGCVNLQHWCPPETLSQRGQCRFMLLQVQHPQTKDFAEGIFILSWSFSGFISACKCFNRGVFLTLD